MDLIKNMIKQVLNKNTVIFKQFYLKIYTLIIYK